jgi:hypothetical protein
LSGMTSFKLKPQIVDQKPAFGRDLVIEQHRGLIAFMGLPIDAGTAPCAGGVCDSFNQSAPCAKAATGFIDIEVLQITAIAKRPIGRVINPIDHADSLDTGVAREEAACRRGRVHHAGEGVGGNVVWQGRFVKHKVSLPKRVPVLEVCGGEGVECDHIFVITVTLRLVKVMVWRLH